MNSQRPSAMLPQQQATRMIRENIVKMWIITASQLKKAQEFMHTPENREMYKEMKKNERFIDSYDLKLYYDCENFLALFSPVAIDLRFVLSTLHISYDLERIGDMAQKVGQAVNKCDQLDAGLLVTLEADKMFEICIETLDKALTAYETENSDLANELINQDAILNQINKQAAPRIAEAIKANPANTESYLHMLSIIRRLERLGDHIKSIAEEIIFYIEADIIKHKKARKLDLLSQKGQDSENE